MLLGKNLRTASTAIKLFRTPRNLLDISQCRKGVQSSTFNTNAEKMKKSTNSTVTNFNVQLLPVIAPCPNYPNGKILLCHWKTGDYKDRLTGLFKSIENVVATGSELRTLLDNEIRLLAPLVTSKYLDNIELKAILRFDGPPDCDEYIYLGTYQPAMVITKLPLVEMEGSPCFWYDWNQIPFKKMPADDEIWYPKILLEGQTLRGNFVFGGVHERTVKSFELFQVDQL